MLFHAHVGLAESILENCPEELRDSSLRAQRYELNDICLDGALESPERLTVHMFLHTNIDITAII